MTLHFHPDRLVGDRLLLEHLALDGIYRSQCETGTSNGGLTAHPGGDRWRWESRLFGGAYDTAPAHERPKYGSLNHRRRAAGGCVRFGSAHLRLAPSVLDRATFCYPDSYTEPTAIGTAAHMPLIALAEQDDTLGHDDPLDDYIEAHVHGPLPWTRDVEAVVLDARHVASAHGSDGWLDPRAIGDAGRSGRWHPQDLKRVWHCTARFGHPTP